MLNTLFIMIFGLVFVKLSRIFFPESFQNPGFNPTREGINSNFVHPINLNQRK
jgi:hypothetical protein